MNDLDLDRAAVMRGDCMTRLKQLGDGSISAVVTDPPYELGFMGKKWDATGIAYSVDLWREVLRVLKPGGHLLAFGGTRTYHRMACAIEDAGFEIRDSLHWMYGTGFPKSWNVSKAIDDAAGAEREVVGFSASRMALSMKRKAVSQGDRDNQGESASAYAENSAPITAPATEAAKQWDGWGTALKPGHEPIVLARKPLEGTVAANVLKWGTGGLNIDGCRIEGVKPQVTQGINSNPTSFAVAKERRLSGDPNEGRWPANVLLDEAAAAELDEQSGTLKSGAWNGKRNAPKTKNTFGTFELADETPKLASEGGASRFFYVAKPSRKERDLGCEHLTPKTGGEATDREDGSAGIDNPRAGAGRTGGAKNYHPTVKPIELMRYLVRLITPPGGIVLDPFTGSGTTGMAALMEGFGFVGIEASEEYFPITCARIRYAHDMKEAA